ncbi:MAG: DNA repair protein RecO [Nitrospira sp.]|nr:DNA repair protein RecO [Candidatus Manganitrophaceae bacterium]HIL34796.1 DNA repair protein RecO [Candidatus Manganitrophaceae bacterium]
MSLLSTEAIVLGSIKLGEADKLVTFYTDKRGKLKGVAKGARRMKSRFGASLEPFTHCRLQVFEKGGDKLARINQSDIVHSFQELREDWGGIHSAFLMAHLVQKMTPDGHPSEAIFPLLLNGLTFLEKGTDPQLSVFLFVVRLIAYSGYQPRWDPCLKCHKSPISSFRSGTKPKVGLYFSASFGGAVCANCAKGIGALVFISQGTLAFLEASQRMDYSRSHRLKPSPVMRKEIETLFRNHLTFITGSRFPEFDTYPVHSLPTGPAIKN